MIATLSNKDVSHKFGSEFTLRSPITKDRVIVVGAGPAGLAAALELVNTGHKVTVLESDPQYVGGLARTMNYKGFRFDIGAHRFFSKNPEITRWWRDRLGADFIRIKRLTRILYSGRYFHYPLRVFESLFRLGLATSARCVASYFWRRLVPIRPERSFEDWVTNRFGDRLYHIFFKNYTEKVWGIPCAQISSDWASQRIKGLSLWKAIINAFHGKAQEPAKTLINEFEYPRLGAGMMWERTRDDLIKGGGRVLMGRTVTKFERQGNRIVAAQTESALDGMEYWPADAFIVSMPLRDCVLSLDLEATVQHAARRLAYRDFILVVLMINRSNLFPDNWIYVHSPEVRVARVENFNNWGGGMTPDPNMTCLEMEYFCSKGDDLWEMKDHEFALLARRELEQLGLAKAAEIIDACVVRMEKAYPVYDFEYQHNVSIIRQALSEIENLQVAGRNAMHKYNNQDHSMLTGILAARNLNGQDQDVWRVNTDAEYQEAGSESDTAGRLVPRPIRVVR